MDQGDDLGRICYVSVLSVFDDRIRCVILLQIGNHSILPDRFNFDDHNWTGCADTTVDRDFRSVGLQL